MILVELVKEWSSLGALFIVVGGLAIGRYQVRILIKDVKELKEQRIDDLVDIKTQNADIKHMGESLNKIGRTLEKLTDREYKNLSDAIRRKT